jgi:hypothetical protein
MFFGFLYERVRFMQAYKQKRVPPLMTILCLCYSDNSRTMLVSITVDI